MMERHNDKIRTSWLRWKIALLMNRLSDTCWADLVSWAAYPDLHDFKEIFIMRHTSGQCERLGAVPYCGKCEKEAEA